MVNRGRLVNKNFSDYIRQLVNNEDVDVDVAVKNNGFKITVEPKRKCSHKELEEIAKKIADAITGWQTCGYGRDVEDDYA